ncbi:MAG: helix-turn-helix domain-containing protein [Clostridium sp.]|nr:helix-turn-helix domain-containing protein [Clostridium sp.]
MQSLEFGEKIYTLRKEKGISQKELGAMLGVSNKAVSKWETGAAAPKTETLIKLAEIFNLSVDDLLENKAAAHTLSPTLEELSVIADDMFGKKQANISMDKKSAKRYLITVITLFVTLSIAFILLFTSGEFVTGYFDVYVEEGITALDNILGAFGLAYIICSVYTGIILFIRFSKKMPTWFTVLCCILFVFTYFAIELCGLILTIPTIITSIKKLKE